MNYLPPPLNNSESAAVKKEEAALYCIKDALAQAIHPNNYYVHCRIIENPGKTGRQENLQKEMELPASTINYLFDSQQKENQPRDPPDSEGEGESLLSKKDIEEVKCREPGF
ncbi:hypothetical protein AYI68_g2888 [Smittium mucronatum]|uniref:Uncharacterized protein n=1 Tax=Smittium mucronatum TaxID=133383 RepID=A0A1R0H1J4_9FUNG|nr:hypothetical protein AYI68_g2888 [Smittium mucronatum]